MSRSNRSLMKKALLGAIVGTILIGVAKALAFKPLSGMDALVALVAFYALLSTVYIGGASLLPQYDPEDEKGKIDKLLKAKREKAGHELQNLDQLMQQAEALDRKTQELAARLNRLAPASTPEAAALPAPKP